ncbi:MAG TPA: YidB family protein [Stellaceae bacterium]|nr:YidB family protein [Stellaceae bacterium]
MGLFDQLVGRVLEAEHGTGGSSSGIGQVLSGLLQGQGGGTGGLGDIVQKFESAGLGHIVQSWIGDQQNLPVSPEQLKAVFGHGEAQTMANQAGLPLDDFLSQLSKHLPNLVDRMTPNGAVEEPGTIST